MPLPMACKLAGELTHNFAPGRGPGISTSRTSDILIHCARDQRQEDKGKPKSSSPPPVRRLRRPGTRAGACGHAFDLERAYGSVGRSSLGTRRRTAPIPPGFFDSLRLEMDSLTGRGPIEGVPLRGAGRAPAEPLVLRKWLPTMERGGKRCVTDGRN